MDAIVIVMSGTLCVGAGWLLRRTRKVVGPRNEQIARETVDAAMARSERALARFHDTAA